MIDVVVNVSLDTIQDDVQDDVLPWLLTVWCPVSSLAVALP